MAFHPNGQQVAVGGADGVIRVLDAQSAALTRAFVPVPLEGYRLRCALHAERVTLEPRFHPCVSIGAVGRSGLDCIG